MPVVRIFPEEPAANFLFRESEECMPVGDAVNVDVLCEVVAAGVSEEVLAASTAFAADRREPSGTREPATECRADEAEFGESNEGLTPSRGEEYGFQRMSSGSFLQHPSSQVAVEFLNELRAYPPACAFGEARREARLSPDLCPEEVTEFFRQYFIEGLGEVPITTHILCMYGDGIRWVVAVVHVALCAEDPEKFLCGSNADVREVLGGN